MNIRNSESLGINPFQLKGVLSGDPFPPVGEQANQVHAAYRRFIEVGDEPVAFVDTLTNKVEHPGETVEAHLDTEKIAFYMNGKSLRELVEDGYYIGPCAVGVVCAVDGGHTTETKTRLAIFKPNLKRM